MNKIKINDKNIVISNTLYEIHFLNVSYNSDVEELITKYD